MKKKIIERDFSKIQLKFQNQWENRLNKLQDEEGKVILNNAPNRIGKTITTLKFFSNLYYLRGKPKNILYLTDRHNQISEVEKHFDTDFKHLWPLKELCSQKNTPWVKALIDKVPTKILCSKCKIGSKNCGYHLQYNDLEKHPIIACPKEFLNTGIIKNHQWDLIIYDENIDKGDRIEPNIPNLTEEDFKEYNLKTDIFEYYQYIKDIVTEKNFKVYELTKEDIYGIEHLKEYFNKEGKKLVGFFIDNNHYELPENLDNILSFLTGFYETVEWIKLARKHGKRRYFPVNYIKKVLDHRNKGTNVIILNTSIKNEYFKEFFPDVPTETFNIKAYNAFSKILHFNENSKSFSKDALFLTDSNGKILLDKNGIATFGSGQKNPKRKFYGKDILLQIQPAALFVKKRGKSTGIITFKEAVKTFKEMNVDGVKLFDRVSYFGGHQGSNKFDDIDVLWTLGTYNVNPKAVLKSHYMLTAEWLCFEDISWNGSETINGMKFRRSNIASLNKVKLFKSNEEHEQTLFRSGALVKPDKLVISYGFVPRGVEKQLKYQTFNTFPVVTSAIGKFFSEKS